MLTEMCQTQSWTADDFAAVIAARLREHRSDLKFQWDKSSGQTRFFVLEDLLDRDIATRIFDAFPKESSLWFQRESFRERKKVFAKLEKTDAILAAITDAFHRTAVLREVQEITGQPELEADPELYAGGLSMMGKGDFLNPHIDNSHDAHRARYRRLNLLYYVTPDWKVENGGNLELWDRGVKAQVTLPSLFNRLVVMETHKGSWHSVSPVVVDGLRCCVSNYYFSVRSPEDKDYYHVTSFMGRPGQQFRRLWGQIDNRARQFVATTFGLQRGKHLRRNAP